MANTYSVGSSKQVRTPSLADAMAAARAAVLPPAMTTEQLVMATTVPVSHPAGAACEEHCKRTAVMATATMAPIFVMPLRFC